MPSCPKIHENSHAVRAWNSSRGVAKLGKAFAFEMIFQKIFPVAIRFHPSGRP
jgi:hypothetical protein